MFNWIKKIFAERFKIGDKVLCIDDRPLGKSNAGPPVVYKKEYTILDIKTCQKCNTMFFDVGISAYDNNGKQNNVRCYCESVLPGKGIWWCNSKRFVKNKNSSIAQEKEQKIDQLKTVSLEPKKVIEKVSEQIGAN